MLTLSPYNGSQLYIAYMRCTVYAVYTATTLKHLVFYLFVILYMFFVYIIVYVIVYNLSFRIHWYLNVYFAH